MSRYESHFTNEETEVAELALNPGTVWLQILLFLQSWPSVLNEFMLFHKRGSYRFYTFLKTSWDHFPPSTFFYAFLKCDQDLWLDKKPVRPCPQRFQPREKGLMLLFSWYLYCGSFALEKCQPFFCLLLSSWCSETKAGLLMFPLVNEYENRGSQD